MKTKLLFVDFEFTSLSPDATPISIGVVSDCNKSIYCEFSDFDLNRCDDWVKENVIGKLIGKGQCDNEESYSCVYGDTKTIKFELKEWLSLFSNYEIQVIVDCGTWDWYHLIQLIAEWDSGNFKEDFVSDCPDCGTHHYGVISPYYKIGLPKLPSNISPVPFDLNDLIAIKKGISPKEAFDLSRSWLFNNELSVYDDQQCVVGHKMVEYENAVHNSLFDAKVIKVIYNKLMNQ